MFHFRFAGDFNVAVYLLIVLVKATLVESFCYPSEACWPTGGAIVTFENSLTGSIVQRGDAKYEQLVVMKNARTTKYPTLMVLVKSTEDVQKSIRFARTHDVRITIQSSGHDFIGRSTDDFSLQINMAEMKDIAVDLSSARHSDGEITVDSGCSWKEIYQEVCYFLYNWTLGSIASFSNFEDLPKQHNPVDIFYSTSYPV